MFRSRPSHLSPLRADWLAALMLAAGLLTGCAAESQEQVTDREPAAEPVIQTADRGPIKLEVVADKDTITIAERLNLKVIVEADQGIDVDLPSFGEQMDEFTIRDFHEMPVEQLANGRRRWVQQYDLDIFLSGEYHVPAVTVHYRDHRDQPVNGDAASTQAAEAEPTGELSTEPFAITVTSLLEGEFDPAEFRDVKGVAELPRERTWTWVAWTAAAIGGLVVLAMIAMLVRRSRKPARVPVIEPHVWAMNQLRALLDENLIEAGRVREFYYRLNEVTRTYIELRFGLMAPERTTEEFLANLRTSDVLSAGHKSALADFLAACDMVKYALYEPGDAEIERVFNTARDFIEQTRPVEQPQQKEAA